MPQAVSKLKSRLLFAAGDVAVTLKGWAALLGEATWTVACPTAFEKTVIVGPKLSGFPTSVRTTPDVALNVTDAPETEIPLSSTKTAIWKSLPSVTRVGLLALFAAVVEERVSFPKPPSWL